MRLHAASASFKLWPQAGSHYKEVRNLVGHRSKDGVVMSPYQRAYEVDPRERLDAVRVFGILPFTRGCGRSASEGSERFYAGNGSRQ